LNVNTTSAWEPSECPLAIALAARLRHARDAIVHRWLERIVARVSIAPERVFPTEDLLDHVPLLIDGIADYLGNPAAEVSTETPVVAKALELGALRHAQGFDAYEILREYEILGGIIFNDLALAADGMPEPCTKSELLFCGHRLFRAIAIIQQVTTTHYLQLSALRVAEREQRLRAFNRALSHEIKNRIGTVIGAGAVLEAIPEQPVDQRRQFHDIILRNARAMSDTVEDLLAMARVESDERQHRHVRLNAAVAEAARQVREAAQSAGVHMSISADIPNVEVNAGIVELCLTNYLTNAIKYRNPSADRAIVAIGAVMRRSADRSEVVVSVADNGLGVSTEKRPQLFQRFFRAHETVTEVSGTGLGLSIVRDAVESVGGHAWAEFPDGGSVFAFALPCRRSDDDVEALVPTAEHPVGVRE
jgi:signal transduction histidine kinase